MVEKYLGFSWFAWGSFLNRSGRSTLITRLAARGVPDEVGMLITGHHTTGGYSTYDRTQALKMEAATLVSANPGLDYDKALTHVSKQFLAEELVGSSEGLKPLIDKVSPKSDLHLALSNALEVTSKPSSEQLSCSAQFPVVDEGLVDCEIQLSKTDPELYRKLTAPSKRAKVSIGNQLTGNQFHNCNVTFKIVHPDLEAEKENIGPM